MSAASTVSTFQVQLLGRDDMGLAKKISLLFESHLGKGYTTESQMRDMLRGEDSWVFGAFNTNEKLVGAATVSVGDEDFVEDMNAWGSDFGVGSFLPVGRNKVGVLESSVVAPKYRGLGIGRQLVEARTNYLSVKNMSHAVSLSWDSGSEHSSAPVLQRCGFEFMFTIPEYWLEDTLDGGYECLNCGSPCVCDAKVYVKDLCV